MREEPYLCVEKMLKDDQTLSLKVALAWAVNTKNSISNYSWFSPYQLVLGQSPSLPSKSFLLYLQIPNNWLCETMDIKAALLQGKEIERDIYVKPPEEAKKKGIIWKLNKVAYGLCDASRQWYFSVKEELCKLECETSQLDKALFRWYANGHLESVFVMHVEDFLYAGTENFKKTVITKIQEKFKVGKHMEGNIR